MPESTDYELLADFARSESEEAFATLVKRYINLVYSTALRFTSNSHHAEEITQAVFIILARKAGDISARVMLSGWLYQTARLTAANFVKGELRRQRREQEAYMQSTLNEPDSTAWQQIAPLLDDAMGSLNEADRNAVVLRFFENKTAAQAAAALNVTEAAAHKRTARSLEKLRKLFSKRGVSSTAAIIGENISAHSLEAAPVALAKSVTVMAVAKGSIAGATTLALVKGTMKTMIGLKLKWAAAIGVSAIIIIVASTLVLAQSTNPKPNPIADTAADSLIITPHVAVGKVKTGMSEDEVIAALGQPERKQGEVLIYDQRYGFSDNQVFHIIVDLRPPAK